MDSPVSAEVTDPDVLVARVISDGANLGLVLYPGRAGETAAEQTTRIERLQVGRDYTVEGALPARFSTDVSGSATLNARLNGRTPVSA